MKRILIYFGVIVCLTLLLDMNVWQDITPNIFLHKWFSLLINFISIIFIVLKIGVFFELYKLQTNYKVVILITFILMILPYHINFVSTNIYYSFFAPEAKLEIEKMFRYSSRGGLFDELNKFPSIFEYSPIERIFSNNLSHYYFLIKEKHIFSLFFTLLQQPFFLLICFCKVLLFKKLNISTILSVIFPINYMILIDKYGLNKTWKFLLMIPIFNLYFMYKINLNIVKEYRLSNINALGIVFLPFIFYPKLIFNNKDIINR
ncbi:hypothetical protein [Empedobacter falsenii]